MNHISNPQTDITEILSSQKAAARKEGLTSLATRLDRLDRLKKMIYQYREDFTCRSESLSLMADLLLIVEGTRHAKTLNAGQICIAPDYALVSAEKMDEFIAAAKDAQIIDWLRNQIAHFKIPKTIDFIKELPRNAAGKVLKKGLRAPYWLGRKRTVG
ncbi:MAG: hypothetical protein L3J58_09170 [Emcibacter sp.]|nr:hypothetical protein [Emcibacter sp.]